MCEKIWNRVGYEYILGGGGRSKVEESCELEYMHASAEEGGIFKCVFFV